MRILLIFAFSWLLQNSLAIPVTEASQSHSDWLQASQHYQMGNYHAALESLNRTPSPESAAFHYNLGTVYLKLNKPALAVAHLEKANHLKIRDHDTLVNLELARTALTEELGTGQLDPASSSVDRLSDQISFDELKTALSFIGLITILLWLKLYRLHRDVRATFLHPSSWVCSLGTLLTLVVFSLLSWSRQSPPVIVIQKTVIRSGPGAHFLQLAEQEAGVKLRILQSSRSDQNNFHQSPTEIWYQVRYSPDSVGWIKASDLLTL